MNNYLHHFIQKLNLNLFLKEVEKICILTQKWLDHLLLMTSYLVNILTGHHWTCVKMRARDK